MDQLKLIHGKKNSGTPSVGRNIGLGLSRGKYIFFMDHDDVIIVKDAFENLFELAEKFQADVIHSEKVFTTSSTGKIDIKNCTLSAYNIKNFVTEPTLITEDFFQRAKDLQNNFFDWNTRNKFIRRDFMIENQIFFPKIDAEDLWVVCALVCSAKRYLHIPQPFYCWRIFDDSLSHQKQTPEKHFKKALNAIDGGFGYLDNFLNRQNFFIQNPEAKYLVLHAAMNRLIFFLLDYYKKIPAHEFDELFRAEFSKFKNLPELSAFSFSRMNLLQINLFDLQEKFAELQK